MSPPRRDHTHARLAVGLAAFARREVGRVSYSADDAEASALDGSVVTMLHRERGVSEASPAANGPELNTPIRFRHPRRAAVWVAVIVLATGWAVLPGGPAAAASPLNVSLTSTAYGLWSGQSATLTASVPIAPRSGVYSEVLRILDQTVDQTVALCDGHLTSGTFTCPAVVSQSGATAHVYYAYASEYTNGLGVFTGQTYTTLTWNLDTVSLLTGGNGENTGPLGTSITLSAVSNLDVGPSPYYLEIFDLTAGSLITSCGSGTICTASISQTIATTHVYRAYVMLLNSTPPVTGSYWVSADSYVTWTGSGETVFLYFNESNNFVLYATAPSVPLGYVIEIFDENTGLPVATCSASPCSYTGGSSSVFDGYVAFIDPGASTTLPPATFLASSDTRQTGPAAGPL
jgi:hypothetical protein